MAEITQLSSEIVYRNKWMTIREDKVRRASGREGIFGVVEKSDFVVIVPIQDGYIYLVEQYRYPVQSRYLELPQGSWELDPDADPLAVAVGELQEETGLIAGQMHYVAHQYLAYGYSNQGYHIYYATQLQQGSNRLDSEEEDLITRRIKIPDFEKLLIDGTIRDATTSNAFALVKLKGLL